MRGGCLQIEGPILEMKGREVIVKGLRQFRWEKQGILVGFPTSLDPHVKYIRGAFVKKKQNQRKADGNTIICLSHELCEKRSLCVVAACKLKAQYWR